jgi:hypothetical protein
MKKRVMDFESYVKESRKLEKVNEGGGAGVEITLDSVDLEARYLVKGKDVKVKSYEVKLSDEFNADGYDDGMHNVSTDMLSISEDFPVPSLKNVRSLDLKFADTDDDKIAFLNDITGSDFTEEEVEKFSTVGDVLDAFPDAEIEIYVNLSMSNFSEMRFGGWMRGDIKNGEVVIGGDPEKIKYNSSDYDAVSISASGNNNDEYEIYGTSADELISSVLPIIVAKEKFEKFWSQVFRHESESYRAFYKEYLKTDVLDDEVDEELSLYLEDNDKLEITIEDFKGDMDDYIDDFFEYLIDKEYEKYWDFYSQELKSEYSNQN